jgi:beta-galactosidase
MRDLGGPGVYASTRTIRGGSAEIGVKTKLSNDGGRIADLKLVTRLVDAAGRTAAQAVAPVTIAAGGKLEIPQRLAVARPRLWQGVNDPYLYRLVVEIRATDGRSLDRVEQNFGIREMRLDPERGFLLNGRKLVLHGTGLHQDVEGKGWALAESDVADTVATLREMGANTIRLTHYQHGQAIHDLADRHGLVLWDEIALVTAWTLTEDEKQAPPGLAANARQQLQELIRQNYNHPSVAVWGIANEVDFGPGRPDFLGRAPAHVPDPMPLLRMLNGLAKAEDPGRATVLATCCEDRGMPDVPIAAAATDAAGANRYFGWYYGKPGELSVHLDTLHARRPGQPLSVSEYGAGGAITMHTDDPLGGPIDMGGPVQPEEYQSWVHEENWRILKAKPYLWGTWLWNGFDFATTVRREGDSQDINTKGLVSYDRKVKEDAFFFYKANWTATPTVHINGRRYVDRAYPVTDVRIYSNGASTELMLNGRSLGAKSNCPDRICIWPGVRLAPGANRLIAKAAFSKGRAEDRVEWQLAPEAARRFRIDSGAILAAGAASGRFGSDAFFEGGSAGTADTIRRGRPPVLAAITGSPDRDLLASFREGKFRYRIPVGAGRFSVSLTFVEPVAAQGERRFDVIANGERILADLDIAGAAGGKLKAITRSFTIDARGGLIDLDFAPVKGKAIVSAIQIEPS